MFCPVAGALRRWISSPARRPSASGKNTSQIHISKEPPKMRKTTMMLVGLLLTGLPGFAQTISDP